MGEEKRENLFSRKNLIKVAGACAIGYIIFLIIKSPSSKFEKPIEVINNNFTDPYVYPKDSGLITPENIQAVLVTDDKGGWGNASVLSPEASKQYLQSLASRNPEAYKKLSELLSQNPGAELALTAAHIYRAQLDKFPGLLPRDSDYSVIIAAQKKTDGTYQTIAVIGRISFPKTNDDSTVVFRGIDKQWGPDKCFNINDSAPDIKPREFQATRSSNQLKYLPNVTLYTASVDPHHSPRGLSGMPVFTVGSNQVVGTFTGAIPRDTQGKELTQQDCIDPKDVATTELVVSH
jgi:hypothetical protein